MKLFTCLLVLLGSTRAFSQRSSLSFGAATSDRVQITGTSAITNWTSVTVMFWAYGTTQTGGRRWIEQTGPGGANAEFRMVWPGGDTNDLLVNFGRASSPAQAQSSVNLALNTWYFVAVAFDGSNAPRMYYARLGNPVSEVSYTTQTAGSGAVNAFTGDIYVGNGTGTNVAFQGSMAVFVFLPGQAWAFTQIAKWAYSPQPMPGMQVYYRLGSNGAGKQFDLSGHSNHGAVTGAVLSALFPQLVLSVPPPIIRLPR